MFKKLRQKRKEKSFEQASSRPLKRKMPSLRKPKRKSQEVISFPESPPRSTTMPNEINFTPGTPDSFVSNISGMTGLRNPPSSGKSMMRSFLPDIAETEECSMDRSNFTWTTNPNGVKDNTSSEGGYSKGSIIRRLRYDSPTTAYKKKSKGNMLTRTKMFKKLIANAFETIDIDKSGAVDKTEMYTGLLMIHLKLATYAGPAACCPATKEYVDEMFDQLDDDNSGTLNKEEFATLVTILCSQIMSKIGLQISMTIMIVPFLATLLVDCLMEVYRYLYIAFINSEYLMNIIYQCRDGFVLFVPPIVQSNWELVNDKLDDGILDVLPLTIMTAILGSLLVPWVIIKSDKFFQKMAGKNSKSVKKK